MSDNGIQDRDDELTVVHVMRHGEVENPTVSCTGGCPATTSPSWAGGWPSGSPSTSRPAT